MTKLAQVGILSAVLAVAWIVPAFTQSANRSGPPSTVITAKGGTPLGFRQPGGPALQGPLSYGHGADGRP